MRLARRGARGAALVLGLACTLGGVATAQNRAQYAAQCAAEMGTIPAFNCLDGVVLPITVNGVEQSQPVTACDNPVQLGLGGNGQCVPFSRLLRLPTNNPATEAVAICRKYNASNGPGDPIFADIAVIQHNKATGRTCFFQSPIQAGLDGRTVPSPSATSHPFPGHRFVRPETGMMQVQHGPERSEMTRWMGHAGHARAGAARPRCPQARAPRRPRTGQPWARWRPASAGARRAEREVVLRLMRGEAVELLSRELGLPVFKLAQWRQKAEAALEAALKEREADPADGLNRRGHAADRRAEHGERAAARQDGAVRPFGPQEVAVIGGRDLPNHRPLLRCRAGLPRLGGSQILVLRRAPGRRGRYHGKSSPARRGPKPAISDQDLLAAIRATSRARPGPARAIARCGRGCGRWTASGSRAAGAAADAPARPALAAPSPNAAGDVAQEAHHHRSAEPDASHRRHPDHHRRRRQGLAVRRRRALECRVAQRGTWRSTGTRYEAIQALGIAVRQQFGHRQLPVPPAASRCATITAAPSWPTSSSRQIKFSGMAPSYAFVAEPETNGVHRAAVPHPERASHPWSHLPEHRRGA